MYPQESETIQALKFSEGHVLELISTGAALPDVLDKICTSLDVRMGNVVSVVVFLDGDEHFTHTIAQYGAKCGLSAFSSTAIFSQPDELLGTFEIYSCLRAPHCESPSSAWSGTPGRSSREYPPSEN